MPLTPVRESPGRSPFGTPKEQALPINSQAPNRRVRQLWKVDAVGCPADGESRVPRPQLPGLPAAALVKLSGQ